MVAMLEEFPQIRVTFNLVPSLVRQVQAYAADRARDRHLALGLKPAAELTPEEARWMVANGFHAPYNRMIEPYPRYAELHAARMERRAFDEGELRDLQVWHKLAWMDPDLLVRDSHLAALIDKARHFTEDDKSLLRQIELDVLSRVVPAGALDVAVLSPDPAAPVRFGCASARAAWRAAAATAIPTARRCAAADRSRDRVSRSDVRHAAVGDVALGGRGLG
jgi:hypothetical protein